MPSGQVVISQAFVWSAILTKRLHLYFYEELGWLVIFAANTAASTESDALVAAGAEPAGGAGHGRAGRGAGAYGAAHANRASVVP